jgi:hypothetical protein
MMAGAKPRLHDNDDDWLTLSWLHFLNLQQVLRLCEAHRLYTALTYVYNQIQEYRRPLVVLLGAVAQSRHDLALAASYKLLVYLRCTFSGRPFPPGSRGSLSSSVIAGAGGGGSFLSGVPEPRAQLLGSILFMEASDLAHEWGMSMDRVRDLGLDVPYPALQARSYNVEMFPGTEWACTE